MSIDHYPMLYAGYTLLDKLTFGSVFDIALEETCAQCNLNHAQRAILHKSYLVLISEDCFHTELLHPGVKWG